MIMQQSHMTLLLLDAAAAADRLVISITTNSSHNVANLCIHLFRELQHSIVVIDYHR